MPISPVLRRNLARMGYEEATPIQQAFLEPVLAGHDAIGLAKTGTGKTTAFLLPIGERLLAAGATRSVPSDTDATRAARRLRALVLCPTRELAIQVTAEASRLLRGSGLRGLCVHGKVAITPQAEALERGVDLLVGTPGRLRDLLEARLLDLSFVRTVALDEADRMLDMGFEPQVRLLLDRIPGDRQTLLLTATMPAVVERLAQDLLRNPVRVEVDPTSTPVTHVRQRVIAVGDDLKVPLLLALLAGADGVAPRQGVLVFCRTRRRAGWIATALKRHGIAVGSLHGDRSHMQRTRSLARFARGEHRVLVATDVASRGLHVEAVKCVVTYDLPTAPEEHVHRIGRAAHGLEGRGGQGEAIVMLSPEDHAGWAEILPLVGKVGSPERTPPLGAFLANAPLRTQRAAGTGASGTRTTGTRTRREATEVPESPRREGRTKRSTRDSVPSSGGEDSRPPRRKTPKSAKSDARGSGNAGNAKAHVEPKRGLKKRGRKSPDGSRGSSRPGSAAKQWTGTGVRR